MKTDIWATEDTVDLCKKRRLRAKKRLSKLIGGLYCILDIRRRPGGSVRKLERCPQVRVKDFQSPRYRGVVEQRIPEGEGRTDGEGYVVEGVHHPQRGLDDQGEYSRCR